MVSDTEFLYSGTAIAEADMHLISSLVNACVIHVSYNKIKIMLLFRNVRNATWEE